MKSKFKIITAIIVITIFSSGITAIAEELTNEFHQAWLASSANKLEISNKFGEIKVNYQGGDSITIDVKVTVEAPNEKKANELLELIEVKFGKSGSTVKAVTEIDNDFKSKQQFSIDYTVNIPSDKELAITNKYGNTILDELNASGDFHISYGNFSANQLNAPENGHMEIYLAYGKANLESCSKANVEVNYSTIDFGGVNVLQILSKYSVLNIEEVDVITADSKYDTFNFEEVESLSATSKYSHFKIEELKTNLKIEAGYGGVKIDEVGADFESISIENSYGQIKLGLDERNYTIDASCKYCGIKYPADNFSGDRIKENNSSKINGKVGSGGKGKVYISSNYGEINLNN